MHLDLDGILSGLVDAKLLLCFVGTLRNLQLIQHVDNSAIIKQQVDPCTAYGAARRAAVTTGLKAACSTSCHARFHSIADLSGNCCEAGACTRLGRCASLIGTYSCLHASCKGCPRSQAIIIVTLVSVSAPLQWTFHRKGSYPSSRALPSGVFFNRIDCLSTLVRTLKMSCLEASVNSFYLRQQGAQAE